MKAPHELQPGDRFYYRYSIGEDVKLWKVVATGFNSLIATSSHICNVPLYYDQMAEPERHYCYLPEPPGLFSMFRSGLGSRSVNNEVA
jgi:hypothetical protein